MFGEIIYPVFGSIRVENVYAELTLKWLSSLRLWIEPRELQINLFLDRAFQNHEFPQQNIKKGWSNFR